MFGVTKVFGHMNKNARREYRTFPKGYYHLSRDGWKEGRLFYTREQYAFGTILLGLITVKWELVIYEYVLMSNHIHVVVGGCGNDIVEGFSYFRTKLSGRLMQDGYPPLPEEYGFKLVPIETQEQMRVNILYLDRNPYEAGICIPSAYPWGTAYLHHSTLSPFLQGQKASEFSGRSLSRLCTSKVEIPAQWEFHPDLGLLPASFTERSLFKKLFPRPKDYQTSLVKDYESFVKVGRTLEERMSFSREEIPDIVNQLLLERYPGRRLYQLSPEEKGVLCAQLYIRYDLDTAQIAAALSVSEHLVRQFVFAKDYGRQRR